MGLAPPRISPQFPGETRDEWYLRNLRAIRRVQAFNRSQLPHGLAALLAALILLIVGLALVLQ